MANIWGNVGREAMGGIAAGAAVLTGALYFTVFKTQRRSQRGGAAEAETKLRENAELEAYRPKLAEIERQLASLKQQLEIERRIVPDEKEVDGFMRMLSGEARKAGIEIRRYISKAGGLEKVLYRSPVRNGNDEPYYSMLGFFDRVGKLERIVNVRVAGGFDAEASEAKTKKTYQYAATETVVATCTTTTYFSHDLEPPATSGVKPAPVAVKK